MVAQKRAAPAPAGEGEEEAFPRGGADLLTPLERRQIEEEAKAAAEQELTIGAGKKSKKARTGGGKVRGRQHSCHVHRSPRA